MFFRLSLGLKMVEVCWSNPTLPIPYSSFNFCFIFIKHWVPKSYGVRCFQQSYSQGTAEIHLSSPAHSSQYPPTPAINSPTPTNCGFSVCTCTSVQPYISGTGGQGTSRRILGSVVPIVSSSRENGNACQHSPEHGNKMYERGGTCTPVQPYISGTGGGAHPGES